MSVERAAGGWRVRWREAGRGRSRRFDRKRDAEAFDAEVRRRRQLGALATLDAGGESLDEYVAGTWAPAHAALLAPATQALYSHLYDRHIGPMLGATSLRDLNAEAIARWQAGLLAAGVGPPTVRKSITLLGGILQRAAEGGRIAHNPQRVVRKARVPRGEEIRPLPPAEVEAIRRALRAREGASERHWGGLDLGHRDAVLVSLLAYAGLRPQEARGLLWRDVRDQTLMVRSPKTGEHRTVRLLAPLRRDLAEWRMAGGRPAADAPVIPGSDGGPWPAGGYARWRTTSWLPGLKRAKAARCRPYDLRHSFASLLLHEGRSVIYVARQLGHGAELTLRTYGHVIDELDGAPQLEAEAAIRAARGELVSAECLEAAGGQGEGGA